MANCGFRSHPVERSYPGEVVVRVKKKSVLLPIFLIVSVDILGLTIVLPLLPFYAERFGANPFVVGSLVTLYAACQLVAGPLLGRISDRVGRRPLLLVSQVGTLIGFLILASANSLWMVFLSRFIDGVTAGNLSLAQAYISDVTEPQDRAKSFAIIGIAFGVGFLFGPAISGFLAQYDYRYPIVAAAGLSFTSICATYFLLPRTPPTHAENVGPGGKRLAIVDWAAYAKFFRQANLAPVLLQFFMFCLAFSTFQSGFALFAERRFQHDGVRFGPKEVGYLFAYAGFLGVILQGGLIGRLVKRFGEEKLALSGFFAAMLGYAFVGLSWHLPALLGAMALSSYGTGILRPTLTSLVSQRTPRSEQGVVLGLNQSLNSLAMIVAPLCSGALIDRQLLVPWALLASIICAVGLALSRRMSTLAA